MGKLIKLLIGLGVLAALAYVGFRSMSDATTDENPRDGVRVEEKYGFTSGGIDGD
jgi:hypothetical protein